MSVVMEGMLSTHWQYSRIILINSNTVLQERKQPNVPSQCTDVGKKIKIKQRSVMLTESYLMQEVIALNKLTN